MRLILLSADVDMVVWYRRIRWHLFTDTSNMVCVVNFALAAAFRGASNENHVFD